MDATDLQDLKPLLARLWPRDAWQPLAPEALPVPLATAALAGRTGSLEWLVVQGTPASRVAHRLSQFRSRQGVLAAVVALDPVARELAIAVTAEVTTTATFLLDHPSPEQRERLRRLSALPPASGMDFALRLTEVLQSEDVGRRFFQRFTAATDIMAEGLTGRLPAQERRALALIQLTRVLFLYFVQAKGWLDGRPDFLRSAVDGALGRRRRLHRDLFRPLFFGTLNRQPHARGRAQAFGRIPFLNGGLFEPHPLEQRWRGDIPNEAWRSAFDDLFEHFHFTVHEDADPGRIAPDMLGRVFEGLMAPEDRRGTGAYYTPAALVRRLVDAGFEALLVEKLGLAGAAARARLQAPDPQVRDLCQDVAVLDPAVGSGAFLLGVLERLAELRAGELPPAQLRRRIVERNLFGVDLNPMAVRLAELRLWLAVIAVDDTASPERVTPLPNLDGMMRQGDSLLDPAALLGRLAPRGGRAARALGEVRQAFVGSSGEEKRELLRRLRRAERLACEESLADAEARLEAAIAECLSEARSATLFGERRGLDRELRQRLRFLRTRQAGVRRLRRRVRREGGVPWFSCEVHFGDVLAQGGFDLVIGNPPWVRAEHLSGELRSLLSRRFRWWRGAGRGFRHQPDLALAFAERGIELLAPGGVLALLLPAKTATAGYARRFRAEASEHLTLHAVSDLTHDPLAQFDATAYPAALVAARSRPPATHEVRLALEHEPGHRCPQARFGAEPWSLVAPGLLDALRLVQGNHPIFGELFIPRLGVKTGANSVFLEPPKEVEPVLVRCAVRGRDLAPFRPRGVVRLFYPHAADGAPFPRLPGGAMRHVTQHQALLTARVDYQGGPPWSLFRVRGALDPHRVAWADLARRLTAVPLSGAAAARLIVLNSCYLVTLPDRESALALAAWLNSTWLRALARARADVASGGFARFNARVVADLPLPRAVLHDRRLQALAERGARGERIQEALDAICAEHLALPPAARDLLVTTPGVGSDDRG